MVNVAVGYSRNHCFDQIPSDSSNRSQILMVDFWTLRFKCSLSGSWISLGSSVDLKSPFSACGSTGLKPQLHLTK
ncbi:hypothetical protein Nepgr_014957 [Nepenthes gracilis]|uniref:Uncharacterized protein n=1 Tax=Nepenthes gracilis TaxID=150966 RepID=A0AAD3SM75_NEPGR|nr:hypothetical protein Nepgr_014957 [Nepenthes gracilis]